MAVTTTAERVAPCDPHHFVWASVPSDNRVAFVGTCSFCGAHRVDLYPWRRRFRFWWHSRYDPRRFWAWITRPGRGDWNADPTRWDPWL